MKTSQVWKECRLLRFVNCFCPFLQLQVSDFLIFLSAFGLFWVFWPSSGQKSQKRAQADKKIKKSSTFSCKKGQKQLTHHKKSLHSFHTSEFSYLRMEFHETFHFIPIASYSHIQTISSYHHLIALEFWFHVIAIRSS